MSYTKGEWLPDFMSYPEAPKKIVTGVKIELSPNYYRRLFSVPLPNTDDEYMKEHKEIDANVKLACAAPDLLKSLKEIVKLFDGKGPVWDRARAAIAKARG